MVMAGLARNVGVLTGGQIEALEDIEPGEQVERAEDRGAAESQPPNPRIADQVSCREMALARADELNDGAARFGQPVPGAVKGSFEL